LFTFSSSDPLFRPESSPFPTGHNSTTSLSAQIRRNLSRHTERIKFEEKQKKKEHNRLMALQFRVPEVVMLSLKNLNSINVSRTSSSDIEIRSARCFISSINSPRRRFRRFISTASSGPLDLTEENVEQVLVDARTKFGQIFDTSVGMTGVVDLAELDGPYVKLRLKGRFWHTREMVLARLGNYLKIRIPEILEVDIEDEGQLDDSPENF